MRVVPKTSNGRISFFGTRLSKWEENADAIGVTEEQVESLALKVESAREALKLQRQAQQTARNATLRLKNAIDAMMSEGSQLILRVRARAGQDGTMVYSRASLPVPKKASKKRAAPGTTTQLFAELLPVGALRLRWKCPNPRGSSGTMYHIRRQLEGAGQFEFLATTGKKKFIDQTLPAGTKLVFYEIQAIHPTRTGEPAIFPVRLGVDASSIRARLRVAA